MNWLQKISSKYCSSCFLKILTIPSSSWFFRIAKYEEYQDQIESMSRVDPLPFNSWFTEPEGRVYLPFSTETEIKIDQDITDVLNDVNCIITDYKSGYCQQNNRTISIPKALQKAKAQDILKLREKYERGEIYDLDREIRQIEESFREMLDTYSMNPARTHKNINKFSIVISQNPHDIAMMSTDRSWTSCMELGTGANYKDVFCEVQQGGLIAYLIQEDDKNINNPLARISIKRFANRNGDSIALPEKSVYGNAPPGFFEAVREWIDSKQDISSGIYVRRGGSSDTLEQNKLVPPKNIEGVMRWYNGEDADAKFSTWIVTDHQNDSEAVFNTLEEAEEYIEENSSSYWDNEDDDEERYTISEKARDNRNNMKQEAIKSIIQAPRDTYPISFMKQIKTDLNFGEKNEVNDSVFEFIKKYPELMDDNDYFQMGHRRYYEYINNLPEGLKKDRLKREELEVAMEYLDDPMQLVTESSELQRQISLLNTNDGSNSNVLNDSISMQFSMAFSDKILTPIENLFKPIPELVIIKLTDFANNIEKLGLSDQNSPIKTRKHNYNEQIISNIAHVISMSGSSSPNVQKFYQDIISSPLYKDSNKIRDNYGDLNVNTIGFYIARLGENGKQFIPWAQQKLKEEQEYYRILQKQDISDSYIHQTMNKNIEKYLYIIDSLQNGTGRSTKYRFIW